VTLFRFVNTNRKVKSQDEDINKLKESNGELSGSTSMMSSRIDTLEKEHFALSQYLGGNILIYYLHSH
jgi:hypothetical protein